MSNTVEKQIELMNMRQTSETANAIAVLNDRFRNGITGPVTCDRKSKDGMVVLTGGVATLPLKERARVIASTATFGSFNPENDPHGEHDYGVVWASKGVKCCWKFGYYAKNNDGSVDWDHGSEDPSDSGKTYRVLTLGLSDEF